MCDLADMKPWISQAQTSSKRGTAKLSIYFRAQSCTVHVGKHDMLFLQVFKKLSFIVEVGTSSCTVLFMMSEVFT